MTSSSRAPSTSQSMGTTGSTECKEIKNYTSKYSNSKANRNRDTIWTASNRGWKNRRKRNQRRQRERNQGMCEESVKQDSSYQTTCPDTPPSGRNAAKVSRKRVGDSGSLGSHVEIGFSTNICQNITSGTAEGWPDQRGTGLLAEGNSHRVSKTSSSSNPQTGHKGDRTRAPRGWEHDTTVVAVGKSPCRSAECKHGDCGPRSDTHDVDDPEIGQVRSATDEQVCCVVTAERRDSTISPRSESHESHTGRPDGSFPAKRFNDVSRGVWTRDVRNTRIIGTCTNTGCKSCSKEVCRSDCAPARIDATAEVVDIPFGSDKWQWCSHPTLVNILDEWRIDPDLAEILASDDNEPPYTTIPGVYYKDCPQVTIGENGTFRPIRPARQMCKAPLAAITNNRMNMAKVRAIMSRERQEWLTWIDKATLERYIKDTPSPGKYIGRYMEREEKWLQEWGVITPTANKGTVMPVFKVPKGEEARLIVDCREVNSQLPKPGRMELPPLHEVYDALMASKWVAQYDGKSYFYQIPLPPDVRDFFQVKLGGKRGRFGKYHLNVLPMGYAYAPAIAQAISNSILDRVRETEREIVAFAWIDNFLFGAQTKEILERGVAAFREICATLSVELKEEATETTKTMEVLGAKVDVTGPGKIFVGTKLAKALEEDKSFLAKTRQVTRRDVYRVLGKVLWVLWAIARKPLACCERMLVIMREIAGEIHAGAQWDTHTTVAMPEELQSFVMSVSTGLSWQPTLGGPPGDLTGWTDASTSGLGYLMSKKDTGTIGWRAVGPRATIFIRELWAAAKMVVAVSRGGGGTVVVDNQAAIRALIAGHSSSKAANAILRHTAREMGAARVEIVWTESQNQSADGLSRGEHDMLPRYGPWRRGHTFRWWPQE
jgi:hypothetical protein